MGIYFVTIMRNDDNLYGLAGRMTGSLTFHTQYGTGWQRQGKLCFVC